MVIDESDLPSFRRPPVVETVLSVEFRPLANWSAVHYGLFWSAIRANYPKVEYRLPLTSVQERFGKEAWIQQSVVFEQIDIGGGNPPVRCLFVNETGGELIQLQSDRFMHNWRKTDSPYPRYQQTRARFVESWGDFLRFLSGEGIATPEVIQCEVTYINHIERSAGWETMADAARIVPLLNTTAREFLPEPEVIVLDERFLMPEERGRLRVVLQPAIRNSDGQEVLQVTLTARGRPQASDTSSVLDWLDFGRRWVVKGFVDVTSQTAQQSWGRTA